MNIVYFAKVVLSFVMVSLPCFAYSPIPWERFLLFITGRRHLWDLRWMFLNLNSVVLDISPLLSRIRGANLSGFPKLFLLHVHLTVWLRIWGEILHKLLGLLPYTFLSGTQPLHSSFLGCPAPLSLFLLSNKTLSLLRYSFPELWFGKCP